MILALKTKTKLVSVVRKIRHFKIWKVGGFRSCFVRGSIREAAGSLVNVSFPWSQYDSSIGRTG